MVSKASFSSEPFVVSVTKEPNSAANIINPIMLFALTFTPSLDSWISHAKLAAVCASSAAGRVCKPNRLMNYKACCITYPPKYNKQTMLNTATAAKYKYIFGMRSLRVIKLTIIKNSTITARVTKCTSTSAKSFK